MYQYPYQVASAFSRNPKKKITTTLAFEAHLSLEEGKIDSAEECSINPLEMHAGYSRFTVCMIRKDEAKGTRAVVTANIPAKDDVDAIVARTRACENILATYEFNKASATATSEQAKTPAYTVAISMGSLKGKTPAQALIEDPNNKKALIEQYKFLQSKLAEYPANQKQMDAIEEAVKLFNNGKLTAEDTAAPAASERSVDVYNASFKPLKSTLDSDGKVLVYSVSIKCWPGRNYPYEVTVKNSRCRWDGQVAHPQSGDQHDEVTIYLPEDKWYGIVADMERTLQSFVLCNFLKQSVKADNANRLNRMKAAKEESHQYSAPAGHIKSRRKKGDNMKDLTVHVLFRVNKKSGAIDTTMTALGSATLNAWALMNTGRTKDCFVFERESGKLVYRAEGTPDFPRIFYDKDCEGKTCTDFGIPLEILHNVKDYRFDAMEDMVNEGIKS